MVDVGAKDEDGRTAIAEGAVRMLCSETLDAESLPANAKKGDVIPIARIAGIMAAKKTPRPDPASATRCLADQCNCRHRATPALPRPVRGSFALARVSGKTGVRDWRRLAAVSVACLTIYDMAKRRRSGEIERRRASRLLEKTGGKVGRLPPPGEPERGADSLFEDAPGTHPRRCPAQARRD